MQIYAVPDTVLARQIQEEMVILDLRSGCYFSLNAIGSEVWEQLMQQQPLDKIAAALAAKYGAESTSIQADVSALLGDLLEQKLITPCD